MEKGVVSSCSIMAPCPAFESFAEYARSHPEKDFGVHLTLNAEWDTFRWGPVVGRERVPSLVDQDGYFWRSVSDVAEHAKLEEVELEIRAQINKAISAGIQISHLDTHMFALLSRADLAELYVRLGMEYGLPVLFPRHFSQRMREQRPFLPNMLPEVVRMFESSGFPIVDFVDSENYSVEPADKRDYFLNLIGRIEPAVTEVIVHCAYDDSEFQSIAHDSSRRQADFKFCASPEAKSELDRRGIELTNWHQLRKH